MLECERFLAAAEDDGVAALDAQAGRVDGDVGPRLVDEEDDAERHADLVDLQAVGPDAAVEHAADRIGQGGDLAQAGRHGAEPGRRQAEAVDLGGGEADGRRRRRRPSRWRRGSPRSRFRAAARTVATTGFSEFAPGSGQHGGTDPGRGPTRRRGWPYR